MNEGELDQPRTDKAGFANGHPPTYWSSRQNTLYQANNGLFSTPQMLVKTLFLTKSLPYMGDGVKERAPKLFKEKEIDY